MENITCVGDLSNIIMENIEGEWSTYFFKASNRKYKVKKLNILDDAVKGIRYEAIEKYNEKLNASLGLVEYGSFDDTHMLKALSLNEESIELMYELFISTILGTNPKTTDIETPLLDRDADGYIMMKNLEEEGNIPLILGFKNKPVAKRKAKVFQEFEEGYLEVNSDSIITFSDKINFIIYGDTLYSLDYKFEKIFFVGDFNRLKVLNILENIEKTGRITPSGMFSLRNSKLKRQLLKYDSDTFNLITEKNIDILNNYGDFNLNGNQFAFEGDFNAKIMIKLFTNRLFFSDGKAWVGKKEELEKPIEEVKFED
jgi:hypothetical protein